MIYASVNAVVSTWALHDLGSRKNVAKVYGRCAKALDEGSVLLNGDFIKPDGATHEFEPGRFEIGRHGCERACGAAGSIRRARQRRYMR
jgi:hypothetical protein